MRISPIFVVLICFILGSGRALAEETEAALAAELKIVSVPLVTRPDGEQFVPIHLRVHSRCIFGDFEALLFDMLQSKNPLAILAVEPILPGVKPQRAATALIRKPQELLEKGFSAQLPIGSSGRAQFLGIALCKDSTSQQSCREKEFVPINSILAEYRNKPPKGHEPPDRVYTYALLIIKDGRAYTTRSQFTPEQREKWRRYLHSLIGPEPDFEANFSLYWERLSIIDPYPMGASATQLVISLPRYDAKKCGH